MGKLWECELLFIELRGGSFQRRRGLAFCLKRPSQLQSFRVVAFVKSLVELRPFLLDLFDLLCYLFLSLRFQRGQLLSFLSSLLLPLLHQVDEFLTTSMIDLLHGGILSRLMPCGTCVGVDHRVKYSLFSLANLRHSTTRVLIMNYMLSFGSLCHLLFLFLRFYFIFLYFPS